MSDIIRLVPKVSNPILIPTPEMVAEIERKAPTGSITIDNKKEMQPSIVEHAAEPIKDWRDIERVAQWFVDHERWRDNMLFILGINFGLRISDLLQLRFISLIDETLTFRGSFPILEKKTANTRKRKQNRHITIGSAVIEAVNLYLTKMMEQGMEIHLSDFLFRSTSNNGKNSGKPLNPRMVNYILTEVARELGLPCKVSTHTLRKTFGYHQMMMHHNDGRALLLLQKMFGHSTSAQTLEYIGLTDEEMADAYEHFNLGGSDPYYKYSSIDVGDSVFIKEVAQ